MADDLNKNPSEYFDSLKRKDQEAFENWKRSGTKKDLGILLDQLSPIIHSEVNRISGSLPTAALTAEAKKWTWKALQTYDPSKGTAVSTHVMNYLPKLRRMNYKFQNSVRLPENMQLKYHDYNHAKQLLTEELNRDPTDEEMAARLKWTKSQATKFKNSLYSDLIESSSERPGEFTRFNTQSLLMEHLMSQLTAEEKIILENSKVVSSTELADMLGVNINRLNYLKDKLKKKITDIQKDSGIF